MLVVDTVATKRQFRPEFPNHHDLVFSDVAAVIVSVDDYAHHPLIFFCDCPVHFYLSLRLSCFEL